MGNKKRSWTLEQLREAVLSSTSYRQVLKCLDLQQAGGNYQQLKKYIAENNLSTRHFKGRAWNKGMIGIGKPLYSMDEILVRNSLYQSHKLKIRLFQDSLKKPQCELCGWAKRADDGRLPLELDHINGDRNDNRLENIRILCPNCHSLQPTHRAKNRKRVV